MAAILFPPTFRAGLHALLKLEAMRHGWRLAVGRLEGSLFEPIRLRDLLLTPRKDAGMSPGNHVQAGSLRAVFSWRNLLLRRGEGWWRELDLGDAGVHLDLSARQDETRPKGGQARRDPFASAVGLAFPSKIIVRNAAVTVRQNGDHVRLAGVSFAASDGETGEIRIGMLDLKQPRLVTVFTDLHGSMALKNARIASIAGMKLAPALTIRSASIDLVRFLHERFQVEFDLAAFGGNIRGELRSAPSRQHRANIESAGTFSQISIQQLSAFLGEDAEGTINTGKFTFHGSLRDLPASTLSLRFEAGEFRWGSRRWNSLVLGATIVNQRVVIPDFQLRQARNILLLNGSMAIPPEWRNWWAGEFGFDVDARIDSLSDLSALFGPAVANLSGKLQINGAVRAHNKSFQGQLKASGSTLYYRTAPLDTLVAVVDLEGNDIRITTAEFVRGSDFLRGSGTVSILGEKRYEGKVSASIADLALYSAFMEPPFVPSAFAGGLVLDWSGDGSANAHSGAFRAQFKKIRPLVSAPEAPKWQPLNLDAEGSYSPENIYFSRFDLVNAETMLSAQVTATPRLLTLGNLRIDHKKATWLEGDVQLPLNLWSVWQNPFSAAWWNFDSPCRISLTAEDLSLREVLLLSGREWPVRGELRGNLTTDGTLAGLSATGQLWLRKLSTAWTPLGPLKTADAELTLEGQTLAVKSASGILSGVEWTSEGTADIKDLRTPGLELNVQVPGIALPLSPGIQVVAALSLAVKGSPRTPHLSGEAQILSAELNRQISPLSLMTPGGLGFAPPLGLETGFSVAPHPEWSLDVHVNGNAPLTLAGATRGTVRIEGTLGGTAADPRFRGRIDLASLTAAAGKPTPLPASSRSSGTKTGASVESLSLILHGEKPVVVARVLGQSAHRKVEGYIFGTPEEKRFVSNAGGEIDAFDVVALLTRGLPGELPAEKSDTDEMEQTQRSAPELSIGNETAAAIRARVSPLLQEAMAGPESGEAAIWNPTFIPPPPPPDPPDELAPEQPEQPPAEPEQTAGEAPSAPVP